MQPLPLTDTDLGQLLPIGHHNAPTDLLNDTHRDELLGFLERRPAHCAYLAGLIYDNGVSNPLNRGEFHGYRNNRGQMEAVALIGHATIIEAANDEALTALATVARTCQTTHLVMCEEHRAERFWECYSTTGRTVRCQRQLLLFELRWPNSGSYNTRQQLRLATNQDIPLLIPVHASMAYEESGVDPRTADYDGFVERYRRRISQGRTWVYTQNDELVFKADVITETAQTSYVEGIWVNPEDRESGYGRMFMAQLARMLLWHSRSISLLVSAENTTAQSFYKRCGYHLRGKYETIFLK